MNRDELELAETRYARARVLDHLRREGFRVVMEGLVAQDGWRAEFLGHDDGRDLVLMAQKPLDAPYLVLATSLDLGGFERANDLEALLDVTSDHDLSPFFAEADRDLVQLSSRLPLVALNDDDIAFWVGNLLACRAALMTRFPERNA